MLRSKNIISSCIKKDIDFYDLAERIMREFEQTLRTDTPGGNRERLLKEIVVGIYKFYAGKRVKNLPDEEEVKRMGENIVEALLSMTSTQREICSFYFLLKAYGKKEIDELMEI